ncbi:MAG: type II secretion system minor pseudopilin GspK, partial [Oceanicaulis sp.]
LIAALLIVALMAAVAVQLTDMTRFAVFRTAQTEARAEAFWYARGAREFAEGVLMRSELSEREVTRPSAPWRQGPHVFSIERGRIAGTIRDGNNCFNINALAPAGEDADPTGRARAEAMFLSLAEQIAVPPGDAQQLMAQIVDWTDPDTRPEPGGAEDDTYARFDPPYRAANRRFSELEELLALPVMTPDLYRALSPWLCVRPEPAQPPVNVNTLALDQAALLSAALGGALSAPDAEAVLYRRPPQGYDAPEQVWADPLLARLGLEPHWREALGVRTRWFEMTVEVEVDEARFTLSQLAELDEGGRMRRHGERFGAF